MAALPVKDVPCNERAGLIVQPVAAATSAAVAVGVHLTRATALAARAVLAGAGVDRLFPHVDFGKLFCHQSARLNRKSAQEKQERRREKRRENAAETRGKNERTKWEKSVDFRTVASKESPSWNADVTG